MRHEKLTHNWRAARRKANFHRLFALAAGACLATLVSVIFVSDCRPVRAQNRMGFSKVSANSGHIALGLALRKLSVSGTFLQAPAHPDDETNALFTLFGYGMGLRVIDVQNNRGDGGQNEIGPELFRDIAVLRTSELVAAHRVDGAEQYFTRAIDYGYSFDPEEVIGKWGRKEIVGDYVRLWRTLRPDVIVTMNIQGRGGDRAHEATTVLVRESFRAAGRSSMYPEQMEEGLRPWQPKKLYFAGAPAGPGGGRGGRGGAAAQGADTPKLTPVSTDAYDPLLGRTYAEIGSDAHSYHKCQGVGGLGGGRGAPGGGARGGAAAASGGRGAAPADAAARAEGADTRWSIPPRRPDGETGRLPVRRHRHQPDSIAQYAGTNPPRALTDALAAILERCQGGAEGLRRR